MKNAFSIALFAAFFALFACGKKPVFEQKKDLPGHFWAYADSLAFEIELPDTSKRHDFSVILEHSDGYPFENLYVRLRTHLPNGRILTRPFSLQLAQPDGAWLGKKSGETVSVSVPILTDAKFQQAGKFQFVFENWMRRDSLEGVAAVGFLVSQSEEKKQ